jgi:hypothetical protein
MDAISRQLSAISQTLKTNYQAEQWQLKAISGIFNCWLDNILLFFIRPCISAALHSSITIS